ncbi:hypothetical protein AVEN_196740-1 [Araneus ventricosus]|uniref:Uncharacterized protein n=1 Tax=Araneus ventricosus TaxID=182803 RepID=A0A4Y2H7F4_ARAVE|nr:hypothetical protein AVEN_196740-1 [Araneus ventricosus]
MELPRKQLHPLLLPERPFSAPSVFNKPCSLRSLTPHPPSRKHKEEGLLHNGRKNADDVFSRQNRLPTPQFSGCAMFYLRAEIFCQPPGMLVTAQSVNSGIWQPRQKRKGLWEGGAKGTHCSRKHLSRGCDGAGK